MTSNASAVRPIVLAAPVVFIENPEACFMSPDFLCYVDGHTFLSYKIACQ